MAHKATLRTAAANKTRSNSSDDIYCCLQISYRAPHHWHFNLQLQNKSIVSQINKAGISVEQSSLQALKPILKEPSLPSIGSLEARLCCKARQLKSNLSRLSKRKRDSLQTKSFIIDVKMQDIVPLAEHMEEIKYILAIIKLDIITLY